MKNKNLTATDYRIYDSITKLTQQHPKLNVAQIAKDAEVAPSSVIKFAKKLGYSGWSEMQLNLNTVKSDEINLNFDDFNFIENSAMNQYFDRIWALIDSKDNILVTAIGDCEYVGNHLVSKLWEHNYKAAIQSNKIMKSIQEHKESGVVILLNESGTVLLQNCLHANSLGLDVISITSNGQSPLAIRSDISLELANNKSSLDTYAPNFFTARLLLFIELLFEYRRTRD